ncbi:DUF4157 domain-containing protein [Paraburkholderia sp. BCC1886]|uniref:eCIS core domain-containing protein n=1 Tax=Paraburkholderia sp. BCC1886 TaxID=2562670 RepID=UPI001C92908B|nr:DUF4157 domain-containing protein [Paraburkholderia sp. BCC1886]
MFSMPRSVKPAAPSATGTQVARSPATHRNGAQTNAARPGLVIGRVDDPLEREADQLAAAVMRMPVPDTPIANAPQQISRKCADCDEDDKLRRKPQSPSHVTGLVRPVPDAVHDTLHAAGHPLDASTRTFFESRFGHDFSGVRVHSDSRANESSSAVDALAYTVGNHVVLGAGQTGNRALLAHELVHVMQQSGGRPVLRRYARCRHLLDGPEERNKMPESQVRDSLAVDAAGLGPVATEFVVKGASAAPWRTEHNPRHGKGDVIDPQIIGDDGFGRADIVVLSGTALEGIEVKRATWADAEFAERQLLNYVRQGNRSLSEVNRIWAGRGHTGDRITSVRAMRMGSLPLPASRSIDGRQVNLSWCRDGVVAFKSVDEKAQDTLLCGVNDQGRVDAFLNRAMDPAQAAVQRYIQQEIEAPAIKKLGSLSLREILGRITDLPQVKGLLPLGQLPLGGDITLELLAKRLAPFEADIRMLAREFLDRVIVELRQRLQAQVRNLLQESMAALCAKATQMTMAELQKEFERRMRQLTLQLVPVVIEAVAMQMIGEMLKAAGVAFIEALAIAIAAVLLWEVAVALAAIEGIGALIAGIGATIARLAAMLVPLLA